MFVKLGVRCVLAACAAALMLIGPAKPSRAVPIAVTPSRDRPADAGALFDLAGQAGLPKYLKCDQKALAYPDGIRGGEVKTRDTDFARKNFRLDVVFQFKGDDDRTNGVIGIGENGHDGGWVVNSVLLEISGPARNGRGHGGEALIRKNHSSDQIRLGRYISAGPHMVRMEKQGDALTFSIYAKYDGAGPLPEKPDFIKSMPDFAKTASYLNRLNAPLFFGGEATFKSVRLTIDGAPVDPGPRADAGASKTEPKVRLTPFAIGAPAPSYLAVPANAAICDDGLGLEGVTLHTKKSDFLTHDFTWDVLYHFKPDARTSFVVGIGENGHDSGNWVLNSVAAEIKGPADGQTAGLTFHAFYDMPTIASLGPDHLGPNLLRVQKRGDTLTFAFCADYKDKFEADYSATVPSLSTQAPYLTARNTMLFLYGGKVNIDAMGLSIDGEPAGGDAAASARPPASATPAAAQPSSAGPLFHLAGEAGIPASLHPDPRAYADERGLHGSCRTAQTDLIDHDFVFDVLFEFGKDEKDFRVGIGADKGDWGDAEDSVCAKIQAPRRYAKNEIAVNNRQAQIEFGPPCENTGPMLLRVEKKGQALTFSLWPDGDAKSAPATVRTLPSLATAAPFLTRTNAALFFGGDATTLAVALSVDGREMTPAPPKGDVAKEITGPENLISLAQAHGLPAYFMPRRDLTFTPDGLNLAAAPLLRTVDPDLLDKDFTFDVVYRFKPDDAGSLFVGMGDGRMDNGSVIDSLYVRIRGPHGGADALAGTDHSQQRDESKWADIGIDNAGPNLLRIEKRGKAVELALCVNYTGQFKPTFVHTFPSISSTTPRLNRRNSPLFIEGGAGTIEQVRLVVRGQSSDAGEVALKVPPYVIAGRPVRQSIAAPAAGRTFSIDPASAPKGLTISPAGELAWVPGADELGSHAFDVRISDKGQLDVENVSIEVVSARDAAAVHGDLAKVDSLYQLPLESAKHRLTPGLDHTELLLEGDQLRRLGPDGFTVRQTLKLPHAYEWIGERANAFVALSDETKSLDLIDKTRLVVTKSIQMDYVGRNDLCLNPARPISYVTVDKATEHGVIHQILIVDETSGDVLEPDDFIGTWIKTSPDGQTLFAGYRDVFQRGQRLLINPNWVETVPAYGNIDLLIVYDISAKQPRVLALKAGAGANGQGIAVSPDGRKVAYLSFTGYPIYSNNIAAWDPADLTKRPVSYAARANKADCKRLSFNPWLPIVAAPAEGGAVCFDRDSGQVEPDRLVPGQPLPAGAKVIDAVFSPDGRELILDCENAGVLFLWKVDLKLSPEEEATLKNPPKPPPPPQRPAPPTDGNGPLKA